MDGVSDPDDPFDDGKKDSFLLRVATSFLVIGQYRHCMACIMLITILF